MTAPQSRSDRDRIRQRAAQRRKEKKRMTTDNSTPFGVHKPEEAMRNAVAPPANDLAHQFALYILQNDPAFAHSQDNMVDARKEADRALECIREGTLLL